MLNKKRVFAGTLGSVAACGALLAGQLLGGGVASAQSVSGWTFATPPNDSGNTFLTNSTIINSPKPVAETAAWTVTGNSVPAGEVGTRPRLFKSGVLCEAKDYTYNLGPVTKYTAGTSGKDCGSGSYNSHGFVSVWSTTNGYREYVTFPTNPLNWTAPATARTIPVFESDGVTQVGTFQVG